uniref:Uncharacterized protein n=1 Tax=Arundo donax TaxID=35708 RepID=A0A0A9ENL2_ARUDO
MFTVSFDFSLHMKMTMLM